MQTLTVTRSIPDEFFGDVLVTAFDGSYGWSWHWFEPAYGERGLDPWLEIKHEEQCPYLLSESEEECDCNGMWMKVRVRTKRDEPVGDKILDREDGFEIDHAAVMRAIQCILDDTYHGIWRPATEAEAQRIREKGQNALYGRKWRVSKAKTGYDVETGETARGYREDLAKIMAAEEPDAGEIDAPFANAIMQVAAFGKVIFS